MEMRELICEIRGLSNLLQGLSWSFPLKVCKTKISNFSKTLIGLKNTIVTVWNKNTYYAK